MPYTMIAYLIILDLVVDRILHPHRCRASCTALSVQYRKPFCRPSYAVAVHFMEFIVI